MIEPFRLEAEMTPIVRRWLESMGFAVRPESTLSSGVPDLLAERNGQILAFELKLNRVKDAIRQARSYTDHVNQSYVVLPMLRAINVAKQSNQFTGGNYSVGLIGVDWHDCRVLIPAKQNDKPPSHEQTMKRFIRARKKGNNGGR